MQRNIIIGLNIFSLGIILTACNFWNNFILFLLVGAIPGTSVSASPAFMFTLLLVVVLIAGSLLLAHQSEPKEAEKDTLPKKRYSRI